MKTVKGKWEMEEQLVLLGCGGHARSVLDILHENGIKKGIVLVDSNAREGERIMGHAVEKSFIIQDTLRLFPAIGDNEIREKLVRYYGEEKFTSIVSCTAYINEESKIEKGVLISHRSFLGACVQVGVGSIINTGSIIEHEVQIGDYVHVAPGSIVCGKCRIGNHVMIGAGTTIIDKIRICDHVIIGAGSVVIHDITVPGTYVGVPVRKIR